MASAPWWNLLFEIVALPVMNTLLPFMLAGILAIVLLALGSTSFAKINPDWRTQNDSRSRTC